MVKSVVFSLSFLLFFSVFIMPAKALEMSIDTLNVSKKSFREELIPNHIQKWLEDKTAFKSVKNSRSSFFRRDSIKIVGYIKGYPKSASFASGIIYHSNDIVREELPTTVRIFEDGRFECSMLGINPISSNIIFNDQRISFYAEPGKTTGIVLDWKDFSNAESNGDYKFKDVSYLGPNKDINDGLASIDFKRPEYSKLDQYRKTEKPDDFKKAQLKNWANARLSADSLMQARHTPAEIKKMVTNSIDLNYAIYLFDYDMSRDYYQKQSPDNEILKMPIPDDYFDFCDKIDLDNRSLMISDDFSTFINRYEFSPLFKRQILYDSRNNTGYLQLDSQYLKQNKETNLIYDIAKIRSLKSQLNFSQYKVSKYDKEYGDLSRAIHEPFLVSELTREYEKYKIGKVAYELPNTNAANVFKKLITPLKGKILIIDFWAQWCGPCRAGIEGSLGLRTKHKDSRDFDFVFITDSESTEAAFYEDFTKKNMMINTHKISPDDYLALRELFKFNGIPRYVLVDAEGKIQDDNFQSYNLQSEFSKYFPDKFGNDYWK